MRRRGVAQVQAPEFLPAEAIRGRLKRREPGNRCAADLLDLKSGARNRVRFVQRRPTLTLAFWRSGVLAPG